MNLTNHSAAAERLPAGAKILFANFPADGHFNPLTGLAVHLKEQGYDVRWYTSKTYQQKIENLGLRFYGFEKAEDINAENIDDVLPERRQYKSTVSKLNFDIVNVFINRGPEYYQDLIAIRKSFAFDLLVCDIMFTGLPFVTDLLKVPALGVGIVPVTADSKDLPPAGLAMTPSANFFGRRKQDLLRWMAKNVLFARSNKALKKVLDGYGIQSTSTSIFELAQEKCALILQTGTPGFEYKRSDLNPKYKFVGPLLPQTKTAAPQWYNSKLAQYKKVVLVTQGTVEKDNTKLLIPTLEAFINTDCLVVVTTGGSDTEALRNRFAAPNVIIEDYIPFADVMPHASVYITNGGMGGVQLSIQNRLPMVTAGVHEGKNEICARVGYFNLGINLKTERPTLEQIRKAVEEVAGNDHYRKNVTALCQEFGRYHTAELCERYVRQLLPKKKKVEAVSADAAIY